MNAIFLLAAFGIVLAPAAPARPAAPAAEAEAEAEKMKLAKA